MYSFTVSVAVLVSSPQRDQSGLLAFTVFAPLFTLRRCLKYFVEEGKSGFEVHVSHLHD